MRHWELQLEQHTKKISCSPVRERLRRAPQGKSYAAIIAGAKCAEASPILKFTINDFAAEEAMIWKET
jgi:hypothetical protein